MSLSSEKDDSCGKNSLDNWQTKKPLEFHRIDNVHFSVFEILMTLLLASGIGCVEFFPFMVAERNCQHEHITVCLSSSKTLDNII